MRIAWLSNAPWAATGYGQQLKLVSPRLKALGHEQSIQAFYGHAGSPIDWNGIPVYGVAAHPFGQDVMAAHAANFKADILISNMDSWVIEPEMMFAQKWCMPAGTLVEMADGTRKAIEKLRTGDKVLSVSKNERLKTSKVKKTWKIPSSESGEIIEIVTDGGLTLEITAENDVAVKTKNGLSWIDAASLIPDMVVYCVDSNPSYKRSNDNAKESNNRELGNRQDKRFSNQPHVYGDGLLSWNSGWGRYSVNTESIEKGQEGSSLYSNSEAICFEHERASTEMVAGKDRHESPVQNQTFGQIQERTAYGMDTQRQWIPLLQPTESDRTVYDSKEGISATGNEFYREQTGQRLNKIQRSVYGEGTRDMVEGSIYKPQNIVSVRRKGRPYDFVYDITTEEGNFFAGGILVHNCAWFPIDSEPCPPLVLEKVNKAFHRIVWTEFAKREMDKIGPDYDYVPYGVDLDVFKPIDRVKARETAHMPQDKFIVGMVAMNKGFPPRKAFYQNIEAFKRLHDKHKDTMLYLHTLDGSRPNGETIDLVTYINSLGLKIGTDVIFADQYSYILGYPDDAMNTLYNCFDVHCLVSMGEGFGMPQLEAQAAGTPVICGDWTTMPELCFSGWKVERKDATPMFTLQNTYQFLPHVGAIADKLEQAYKMRGNTDYATRAVAGAKKYDINKIVNNYWKPTLEKIEAKLQLAPAPNLKELAVLR